MKRLTLLLFMCFGVMSAALAQRTVSGTVTDDDGTPLIGASVEVKDANVGTTTDIDGQYTLEVPADGNTLIFSYVGFGTREVELGASNVVDLSMSEGVELTELVVTALGIPREKRSLGYAVDEVKGEALESKASVDVSRLLKGKVPGVDIVNTSGVSGAGTNITIRGYTSISGTNQPLFVVDGVPVNTGTNNDNGTNDFLEGGQSTSSRFLDIDPNNIKSVSVLKGLSAATLYGQQGRNGVILIETKNGSGAPEQNKTSISLSQSYYLTDIASLPDYQTNYGGGFHQNFGFFFSNWGPNFDRIDNVAHPLSRLQDESLKSQFPEYQNAPYEYKNYNSVENFFRTGKQATTSVAIKAGNEEANFGATFAYTDEEGFTPGNELTRLNFGIGGNLKLANNFTLNSSFNFVETDYQTPPISYGSGSGLGVGTGLSVFADVFYTPRSVDLTNLPFESPLDNRSVYYRSGNDIQNPLWTAKYARNDDDVRRFFGQTSLTYDISDKIGLTYKLGLDTYSEEQAYVLNKGSVASDDFVNGLYRTTSIVNTIWDHSILGTYNGKINDDLGFNAVAGWNFRRDEFNRDGLESANQLTFGFEEHSNFTTHSSVNSFSGIDIQRKSESEILGVMASATLDYKSFVYLNLAARKDWASTLEEENNSILYPSASVAFIPTELMSNNKVVQYLKLRLGYGTSAGFPPTYGTRPTLRQQGRMWLSPGGAVLPGHSNGTFFTDNGAGSTLGNPNLKPELQTEIEFGVEGNFFDNRIALDASIYNRKTEDLITNQSLDPSTGSTSTLVNIGEIENDGIELGLTANPVRGDLNWEIGVNFYTYNSVVTELDQDEINIAGFSNLGNFAVKGESFGVMKGSARQTDDQGRYLIDNDGYYLPTDEIEIIGDPIPDFISSITNTLSYKNLTFGFEFAYRKGGDVYSGTARALLARGLSKDTDFDRTQAFVLDGVTSEGEVNTRMITATNLYFDNYGFGPSELSVFDGTTIRLREVSLSYDVPSSIVDNTPLGGITITLLGSNLWYNAINFPEHTNVDPDALGFGADGNGRGFEFLNGPSARQVGGSIRIKF